MLRFSRLAVLALIPLSAFAAGLPGQPGCDDASLAAVMAPPNASSGVGALFSPQYDPQNKVCIYICDWWGDVTATYWGMGSDCNASYNDLTNQIAAEAASTGPGLCDYAGAALGYCGFTTAVTGACHWDSSHGMYVTDGYGKIKCKDYC